MRVACVAVLLLLAVSCARSKPEMAVPEPKVAAPQPRAPQPPPTPATPAAPPPAQPATTKVAPHVAEAPAPAPSLDLTALKERLKDTKAIGLFTKIALKNKIDDLLDQFRAYHQGNAKVTLTELRRSYELLIMKVLSLLQDEDRALASSIVSSREAIWGLLADPKRFAALAGLNAGENP